MLMPERHRHAIFHANISLIVICCGSYWSTALQDPHLSKSEAPPNRRESVLSRYIFSGFGCTFLFLDYITRLSEKWDSVKSLRRTSVEVFLIIYFSSCTKTHLHSSNSRDQLFWWQDSNVRQMKLIRTQLSKSPITLTASLHTSC